MIRVRIDWPANVLVRKCCTRVLPSFSRSMSACATTRTNQCDSHKHSNRHDIFFFFFFSASIFFLLTLSLSLSRRSPSLLFRLRRRMTMQRRPISIGRTRSTLTFFLLYDARSLSPMCTTFVLRFRAYRRRAYQWNISYGC